MVDAIVTASPQPTIPDDLKNQFLDAIVESIAIGSGRGSNAYVTETLLTRHDRFGNSAIQLNSEMVGMTFMTKPCLNMTDSSLRQDRTLVMLDTLDPLSFMFALRCNLDTVFAKSAQAADLASKCPWFNDQSPFMVPASNCLIGMSGWPDWAIEYETTESGYYSEDMTLARGSDWGRRTYDLSCTFRDIQGGFMMAYFYYWTHAMALQMDGTIVAYPEDRDANRLNYTVSFYRFVLDPSMRTITKWAKATGCFPVSVPIGDVFNFGPGDSFIHTSQQFTVPFKVNNIRYMDPIALSEFNQLIRRYAGDNVFDSDNRVKTTAAASTNFTGVPYIDLFSGTNELMWLAEQAELIDPTLSTIEQIKQTIQKQTTAATSTTSTTSTTG